MNREFRQEGLQKMAVEIKKNPLNFFEFIFMNNPVSLTNALRVSGLTTMVSPNGKEVGVIISRHSAKQDMATLRSVVSEVKFNPDANNFTTSPELWAYLFGHVIDNGVGVSMGGNSNYGDFLGLFDLITQSVHTKE